MTKDGLNGDVMDTVTEVMEIEFNFNLPEGSYDPESSVRKIQRLTKVVKPKVVEIVREFWIAHEMIVTGKAPKGWTWTRFCRETGYHPTTPYNWFK